MLIRRHRRALARLYLCTAGIIIAGHADVWAGEGKRIPSVSVPRIVMIAPGFDMPLPLRVETADVPADRLIVELRGVPGGFTVSGGKLVEVGVWQIPVSALPNATLGTAGIEVGRIELSVSLLAMSRRPQSAGTTSPALAADRESIDRYNAHAQRLLKDGNVSQARRFLQRAAEAGDATAALTLARTFEASELTRMSVFGLLPDPNAAARWRSHAQALQSDARPKPAAPRVIAHSSTLLVSAPKELMPRHDDRETPTGTLPTQNAGMLMGPSQSLPGSPTPPPAQVSMAAAAQPAQATAKVDAERLLQQGEKLAAEGRVAQARQFFRRAADAGLAVAALRLGGTYDGRELSKLQVRGLKPDHEEARRWYSRARELGASIASERVMLLDKR
jgi:TPR repeat protein